MINPLTRILCCSLLVGTTLTSACSFIPRYERPASPVSASWLSGADPADAKDAVTLGWSDFFQSPELRQLINKGLANNRDLRIAALNIETAQAQYRIQRSNLLPTINGTLSMSRSHMPAIGAQGFSGTFSQYTANIATTAYELDVFGRLRSLNQTALETYLATAEARNTVQISLIRQIAAAYLTLLADREQSVLSQQTLESQQKSYDLALRKFNVGVGTKLELRQSETLLETARVDQIAFARQTAQDRNALELLVGAPLDDMEITASFADADHITAPIKAGLPSDLLLNRPDIRQAEHNLKSANANIGAARAAFFPTITLTASGGLGGNELSGLFESSAKAWSFSPQITIPIFNAGRNKATLDVATLRKEITVAQYEKAIQTAFREVSDALVARETLTRELAAQGKLVAATQDAYDIANMRHEKGIADYLTVLDARRNLYGAQQRAIATRLQIIQNYVQLYAALGGGQTTATPSNP